MWDGLLANEQGVAVWCACLMPDHLHLLVSPDPDNVMEWVARFKSIATRLAWTHGHRGALWQPSFHDRALREGEYESTLAYVVNNARAAGLVGEHDEWPWVHVKV